MALLVFFKLPGNGLAADCHRARTLGNWPVGCESASPVFKCWAGWFKSAGTVTAESYIWPHPALHTAAAVWFSCLGLSSSERCEHTTVLKAHIDPPWSLISVIQIVNPHHIVIRNPRWVLWAVGHDDSMASFIEDYHSAWFSWTVVTQMALDFQPLGFFFFEAKWRHRKPNPRFTLHKQNFLD